MAPPAPQPCVVGLGEALFDVFDSGPRLGGAPLNVAAHAHRLLSPHGGSGQVVSRYADDDLGQKLLDEVRGMGLFTDFLQGGAESPTGRVEIEQDASGHTFHIAATSAWDEIELTPEVEALARACDAVAFGSLAQRTGSRPAIQAFVAAAENAIKLFDVNLRSSDGTDFYDAEVLLAGCTAADLVKLNDEELETVCEFTGTQDAEDLRTRFDLRAVVFTRGADGTAAYTADGFIEGPKVEADRVEGADTVGAGDACSAGLLSALVLGRDLPEALGVANHMGAFVAGQVGATPALPERILRLLDA